MSRDQLHGSPLREDTIAVVGMAGRFPGAPDVSAFWAANLQGNDCITRWRREDTGDGTVPAGGLLADLDLFDPEAFGLTPAEADLLDPQHRVFAESCWLALEHAAVVSNDSLLVSVYASAAPSRYRPWAPDDVNGQYRRMIANAPDFLATRVSYLLDLRGEAVNVQTACSSSLLAVHLACQSLQSGRSDVALAGGVSIDPDQHLGYRYQDGMVASPDGRCRPFDQRAQGAVPGNGSAVVVLQRLSDALAQGRRVHAVIRSSAVNQDGRAKSSFMAPSVDGQAEVIVSALALADVTADSVRYLEAHGTGTRIGDPIEFQAATEAFRSFTDRTGFCSLGSLKAGFGHLDRAAGVAGLIKAVHVVREGVIPPLMGFEAPNPDLQLTSSPFRIDTATRVLDTTSPRRAGVSAFGVGGTNAHVIVEEPPPPGPAPTEPGAGAPLVLVTSAHAPEVLQDLTGALAEHVRTSVHDATGLGSVARTLGSGRTPRPARAAVVVRDVLQASNELRRAEVSMIDAAPGRVALLFAGQGAETAYRPERLMSRYAVFREEIRRFADALRCSPHALLDGVSGRSPDVRAFAYQPSLAAVQVALARLAQDVGIEVEACCGSSVGEYAAAHMAGVLDHEALMGGLAVRAEAMARSAEGRLISLSCSAARAQELLVPGMELAGDNAVDRALVSGPLTLVDRQLEDFSRAGVRARVLPGRIAPHSALMDEAMAQVAESISGVVPGNEHMPVVSTSTGGWIKPDQLADPAHWAQHMRGPIRFRQALLTLIRDGFGRFVEASPGSASAALVTRLDHEGCHAVTLGGPADGDPEESLLTALADLWMAGVDVDWDAVNATQVLPYAELPDYPFRRQRHWSHSSAGHEAHAQGGGVLGRPSWRPSARFSEVQEGPGLPGSVTVRGEGPLAVRLMARLRAAGVAVTQTDPGPGKQPGPELARGGDHGATGAGHVLVDLSQAERPAEQLELYDVGDVRTWLRRRLLDPAEDVARSRADRILVVTRGAQSVLPGERASMEAAGAVGLARCLPHEQPGTAASLFDLPGSGMEEEEAAAVVVDELRRPADRDVAFREGVRYERGYEVVRTGASMNLRQGGTYLVLGGTGHLGAVVLDAISREVRATLVVAGRGLISRRPEEQARLVNHARERGCTVVDLELDVTDGRALAKAFDDLQGTYGRVDGVFHLAAATDVGDFPLLEEGNEDLHARVAAAKVLGAAHLSRVVANRDLDFVCLFSSLSTVIGALRFGAYVSANALLDAFAEAAGGDEMGCRWTSVVWDGWAADGRAGHDVLGHEDGADLLRAAMRTRLPVITATTREVESRRDSTARDLLVVAAAANRPAAVQDATIASVAQTVAEVTGHLSVSPEQRLAAIGVDSLQMMQIAARLRRSEPGGVRLGTLLRAGSVAEIVAAMQAQGQATAPAVVRAPQDDPVTPQDVLSSVQERLWFLDQLDPDSAGYHVPFGWRLPRGTSLGAARMALQTLLDRHPILRSAYGSDHGGRVRRTELDVGSVEVLELAADATEEAVRYQIERPLDLGQGSTRVLLRDSSPIEVIFVCHHISVDAWSVRLLHEDLVRVLAGDALAPAAGRYADFVRWERERRQDPGFAADLAYWRDALHDVSAQPPPPDDGAEVVEPLGPAATTTLLVPQSVVAPLRERLANEGATLFAAGLTGLSLALGTWSHRATSVIGTNMANRPTPQVEGVVGMFVDPVVLVLRAAEAEAGLATTGSALAHVRRTLVEAMSHADVPYADVVEAVARARSHPLISVMATMFDTERGVSRDLLPLDLPQPGAAKFPLAVEFLPKPEGLLLHALYARDLYRRATIDRVLARTARYLQVLAERGPHMPLSELEDQQTSAQQRFASRFGGSSAGPAGPNNGTAP